jgi:Glycosyl transferase family 11
MQMKIIPRIFGGLGNQLFCYAAARRLALVNNAELVIDDVSGFVRDHTYQRNYQLDHFSIPCRKATAYERLEPFSRVRRFVKRKWNQRLPFAQRIYIQQKDNDFDPRLLQVKPLGILYLEGYWQSEEYFKDVEETIRADLQLIPPTDTTNLAIASRIRDCLAVAVHVRFFDAPTEAGINNAHVDYYSRAVAAMEAIAPDAHYFLFSDRPAAARASIPLPDERLTCLSHNQGAENAYADLWLMTQCKHFIIANSTFSWWGAWLSDSKDKVILAPKFQKLGGEGSWGFEGLIPESWIGIDL